VKISGAYYREVLLTQKLMPVMWKICGEFFIFEILTQFTTKIWG